MKQEIDPKDIRPGDLIREERNPKSTRPFSALEFTATEHTHTCRMRTESLTTSWADRSPRTGVW